MKKLLFTAFIFIGSICSASNLEFSRVLLGGGTVPTGKIWEITAIAFGGTAQNGFVATITINGAPWQVSTGYNSMQTIWLPEGTTVSGNISIIEYNVVP